MNKTNNHVHHLNNSKLANVTVLAATFATAATISLGSGVEGEGASAPPKVLICWKFGQNPWKFGQNSENLGKIPENPVTKNRLFQPEAKPICMSVGRIFSRWAAKVLKFVFFPTKTKKTIFFAKNFKIQGSIAPPVPLPSDAHLYKSLQGIQPTAQLASTVQIKRKC